MASSSMLFSDIEGSTRLLQRLGSSYAPVLQDHQRLLRHCFSAHGGQEEGTEGDSFFVLFDEPKLAVAAALEAQRALRRHHWPEGIDVRVRMGVHTGEITRVGEDLVGMAIHEAARIMSSAHGGQVLASGVTASLIDELPGNSDWRDLGDHRLKDLPAPMRLLQLLHPDLEKEFPPPKSQLAGATNLPAPTTSLIGRDAETAEVCALVRSNRFVTLTGAGGAGKTRLAIRAAAELEEEYDGVWLIELAPVTDSEGVATAMATAVGAAGQSTVAGVGAVIGHSRALLVVDNCEHLVEDAADAIDTLLRGCPNVTVIATSREPLGLPGEVSWRVPSLRNDEAVELFIARAHAADPRSTFDDASRATALSICERLDGIPLAIELAVARLPSLGIDQLAERLDQRFRLLTGGRRGGLARQRTLQAAVDWSYDLLDPDGRQLFRWLGPFVGGFSLEAAEHVGVASGLETFAVLDHLDALVQKSLAVAEEYDGVWRYRLLETIRQYALDRLLDESELVAARDAHLAWVHAWCVQESNRLWVVARSGDVYDRADAEGDNIRAALDWALEQGHAHTAVEIGAITSPFWFGRGYAHEGMQRLAPIAETGAGTPGQQLAIRFGVWICASNSGEGLDPAWTERLDELARDVDADDPWVFISAMYLAYRAGDVAEPDEARRIVELQLERSRAMGSVVAVAMNLQALTNVFQWAGEFDAARATIREMLSHCERNDVLVGTVRGMTTAMHLELTAGREDAAWEIGQTALARAREQKDGAMVGHILFRLGLLAARRNELGLGAALSIEAIESARRALGPAMVAMCETHVAWFRVLDGDAANAFDYAEAAADRVRTATDKISLPAILHTAGEAARLTGHMEIAIARHLEGLDATVVSDPRGVSHSLLLGLAAVAASRGEAATAAKLFGASDAHGSNEVESPAGVRFFAEIEETVRAAAGERFDALRTEGAKLSLEEARDLASSLG